MGERSQIRTNTSSARSMYLRGLLWSCIALFAMGQCVHAQTRVVQLPNVQVAAGIPSGSATTVCAASIPTLNATNDGDGCLPTQATISNPQAVVTDSYGNVYIADSTHLQLRVIYNGNPALAAAIVASYNNSSKVSASTVKVGNIYTLVGGCSTGTTGCSTGTSSSQIGSATILSSIYGIALDADGNVFFDDSNHIRIFYVAGTKVISLLQNAGANPGSTGKPGYEYTLMPGFSGYSGDGGKAYSGTINTQHGLAVDSSENLYIADWSNNAIRMVSASTGYISTFVGGPGCVQGTKSSCTNSSVDGLRTSATTAQPNDVTFDSSGNLYFTDYFTKKVRAVYMGSGSIPGVSSPQTGYVYTVIAGAGTNYGSGATLSTVNFNNLSGLAFDLKGNLYVQEYARNFVWMFDQSTGIGTRIAGGGTATTVGGACSSANSSGSKATDTLGDGCLGSQAVLGSPYGHLAVDPQGNVYFPDSVNNLIRVLSTINLMPSTATGSSSAVTTLGFSSIATQTLGSMKLGVQGGASSDFADAGSSTCTSGLTFNSGTSCLLNLKFSPTLPGYRKGFVTLTKSGSTPIASFYLGGVATGAELAVDPGTQTTVGTGLSPTGVSADALGNIYVADSTSSSLLQYASSTATTSTSLITGLSSPGQVAVDGEGNVAVADAGNNRLAIYNPSTAAVSALTDSLSAPTGVAVDAAGNYYVADSGNNRVVEFYTAGGTRVLTTSVSGPTRLSFDGLGNLYIVDAGNSRVVEIPGGTGTQTTVNSGSYTPAGIAVDPSGNLYVLDSGGLQVGVVTSVGDTYTLLSGLKHPADLSVDALGNLYVVDTQVSSVTVVNRQNSIANFGNVATSNTSAPLSFLLTAIGGQPVEFNNSSIASMTGNTAAFAAVSGAGQCNSTELLAGRRCSLSYTFTPQALNSYSAALTFPSNVSSANTTTAQLNGTGVATTNTLAITPGTISAAAGIAQSITVTASNGSAPIASYAGTIHFSSTDSLASLPVNYTFTAGDAGVHVFYNVSFGTAGTQTLTVTDAANSLTGIASVSVTGSAGSATTTVLSSSATNVPNGATVTLTALISSSSGVPTGTVSFQTSSTSLGTATLSNGSASISTTTLPVGTNLIVATYIGNASYATSTSSAIAVTTKSSPQNVWIVNANGTLSELSNSGAAVSGSAGYAGGGTGIAIDGLGNVWSTNTAGNSLTRFSSDGLSYSTFAGGGLSGPVAVAVSGEGYVWIVNMNNTLSWFDSSGTALSPATGMTGGNMSQPSALTVDGSGNIWIANQGNSSITEFIGAADPVVTPAAIATQTSMQGTRP